MVAIDLLVICLGATPPVVEWSAFHLPPAEFGGKSSVGRVFLSPNGEHAAVVLEKRTVAAIDARDGTLISVVNLQDTPLFDIAFAGEDELLVSTGSQLLHISVDTGAILRRVHVPLSRFELRDGVTAVGQLFGADRATDAGNPVALVNVQTGAIETQYEPHQRFVYDIAWNADRTRFVAGGFFESLYLGEAAKGPMRKLVQLSAEATYRCVCFSPDGEYVVAGESIGHTVAIAIDLKVRHPVESANAFRVIRKPSKRSSHATYVGFRRDDELWLGATDGLLVYNWPTCAFVANLREAEPAGRFNYWAKARKANVLAGVTSGRVIHVGRWNAASRGGK